MSGEDITTQLFGTEKVSGDEYAQVYQHLRQEAIKLISQNKSVVIDGTNLKREFRQQIYNEVKCNQTILIYLKTDDKTALDRISKGKTHVLWKLTIDLKNNKKSRYRMRTPLQ